MSITIEFSPWGQFHARKNHEAIRSWLKRIGDASKEEFTRRAGSQWGGGRGAQPGQWPMRRSGHLISTIDTVVDDDSVTIGSNAHSRREFPYSAWLQKTGRKMSREALEEGLNSAGRLTKWVAWVHGAG